MAITYPTSLDTFTNPTSTSLLTSPDHAQQHSDINDAVEALEAKVAIGNTVIGAWIDYTPTWTGSGTNPVIGNGSITGRYSLVSGYPAIGAGWGEDASAGAATTFTANVHNSGTTVFGLRYTAGSGSGAVTSTAPYTWATSDFISATIQYKAA